MQAALKNWIEELGISSFTSSRIEILSGLTVALALVPEAVAFAFVAQVHPLVGLYAAFIVGLITAIFGGRPGMISGATGALAVVMVALVMQHGVEYLFATVVLMGIFQILAGVLRWGKFIRMVPYPVMLGFVNGLAIVIFLAQMGQFKAAGPDGSAVWMSGGPLMMMLGLTALTMLIIQFTPKLTTSIPAPLMAIGAVSLLVIFADINVPRGGDLASIEGGLPLFHIPSVPFSFETFKIIFPYSLTLAAIGLIESLLTLNLVGEMTNKHGGASRECAAQGVSNLVTGFFGGMGGCAMIGQSMINVKSGGKSRISGIAAALVGVMFMVVIGTFAWRTFEFLSRMKPSDVIILIIVTTVTVISDLAMAVIVGVIISALVFSWESATHIHVHENKDENGNNIYTIFGPLFFGSTDSFLGIFAPENDTDDVIIDFLHARVWDSSGIEAIDRLADKYEKAGKKLHLCHLSDSCKHLLKRADRMVEVAVIEDPLYEVVVDYSQNYRE